ncbi:hypothetical protein U1Q18_050703, partial [Sarracenia purpurea var. burkii]
NSASIFSPPLVQILRTMSTECANGVADDKEKYIDNLERQLDEQNVEIRLLRNEIEKYKQIVRPLTNMVFSLRTIGLDDVLIDEGVEKEN